MTADAFTRADPLYRAAMTKGVRLLPLEPTRDDRPGFGLILLLVAGACFFTGLFGGLVMMWGAG